MSNDKSAIPESFSDPSDRPYMPHRSNALAIAEGVVLLGGLAALDYFGLLPFSMWPVHPYLFVVILLSAQYGIQGGIAAAMGAIALSQLDGWSVRPIDMPHAEYFRMTWTDSLSWVLAALTVGLVTSHQRRVLQEQTTRLQKAVMAESLIAAQYQVLAQRTHDLERSLAGRADAPSPETTTVRPIKKTRNRSTPRARLLKQNGPWNTDSHP